MKRSAGLATARRHEDRLATGPAPGNLRPMDWYYAEGKERRGPVSEQAFTALIQSGAVKPETLVWNPTLTQWTPLRTTTLGAEPPLAAPGTQRCIITGKFFPTSQMIQTEHGWVSAEGRDTYYQSLRENVPLPVPEGMSHARAEGKYVVVPATNAVLPLRCVKTNQPVTTAEVKTKKLYHCTPWILLAILLNILVVLILYLVLRKKVVVQLPISREGRRIVRNHALSATALAAGGLILAVYGFMNTDQRAGAAILGVVLCLAGLIYGNVKGAALRAAKLKSGEVWLLGASREFLASLPPYRS